MLQCLHRISLRCAARRVGCETMKLLKQMGILPGRGSRVRAAGRMLTLAGCIGIAAGVGAVAFQWITGYVADFALAGVAGYSESASSAESATPWLLLVVLPAGGLLSGFLVYKFAPEAAGPGLGDAIDAYHNRRGEIRARVPLVKILASAITLGTGGSGGREGPIGQVGAGIGSYFASRLKLSTHERRALLAAGMGAGIGAVFRAPLAGAIFAVEILYTDPDFETEAMIPAFFATTVAYSVSSMAFGVAPILHIEHMTKFDTPILLVPLTVLAGVMVILSWAYTKCLHGVESFFSRLPCPNHIKPGIGALAAGLVAVAAYICLAGSGREVQHRSLSVLSYGYGFLQTLLRHGPGESMTLPVMLLLVVGFGKVLTTSLTIGSGGAAGVFGPSMVIGGATGAVVGLLFHNWMPSVVTRIDIFVILGMAAFFAASANTPVSTLIMVSEITGSHALLLPSMWVCALAYLLSKGWSLFNQQVARRTLSPAHRSELAVDVLEGLTVADAWKQTAEEIITVPKDMLLSHVAALITGTRQSCFPVVDTCGGMCGYFSLNDIRYFLYDQTAGELVRAEELATTDVQPLTREEELSEAIGRFAQTSYDELPIAESLGSTTIIGLLRRPDVIAVYRSRLAEMQGEE